MKKTLLLALVAVAFAFTSCDKNQKVVKQLDGSWELVSADGVAVADEDKVTMTFDNCKLKKDEYCTLTSVDAEGVSEVGSYKVTDDGEQFTLRDETIGIELSGSIDELTADKFVITLNFLGTEFEQEFKKI